MTVLIGDLFRQPNSVSRENYFTQIIIEITRFNIRASYMKLSLQKTFQFRNKKHRQYVFAVGLF